MRTAVAVLGLLVAGCAATTVQVGDWTATCDGTPAAECHGVAALFVNNLARNQGSIQDASGARVIVTQRACPLAVPAWADRTICWQAAAAIPEGSACMVIARHPKLPDAVSTFGQVGGDQFAGLTGPPPAGWPMCE